MSDHPGNLSLRLYRGDSYSWIVKVWGDEAHTTPVDLAGATPRAEIRGPSGTIVLPCVLTPPNEISVELPAASWSTTGNGTRWDLQLAWTDGRVYTLLAGSVSVQGDVVK